MAAGHGMARGFAALSPPLSPACYRWCHFINKAITLQRGGEARGGTVCSHRQIHINTLTHSGQVLGLPSLESFNPDQLSSEARGFMGHWGAAHTE